MGLNMARTRNSFTGSAGDDALVDKTLGRSYDVVKAVYKKLPELEELQQNPNINTLVDNFDKVEEVLQSTESIINVNTNLSKILAAETYSQQAQAYSKNAASAAATATAASQEATTTLNDAVAVRDSLEDYKADLDVVATNIKAVQTTSANIAQINNLSSILTNNLTIPKLDAVLNELDDIITVSDNIQEVVMVANRFIGSGELDRIEAANTDIKTNLLEYRQILEDFRQEVTNAALEVDNIEDAVKAGVNKVNVEAEFRRMELNSTLEACKDLLEQVEEGNAIVNANVDEANQILLKIRDIYHSFEEGINRLNHKVLLEIQHAGDHQVHRIRKEGDVQAERLYDQMTEIINAVLEDMKEQADEILKQKLEELQQKADEVIAQIDAKLEEIKTDLSEFEQRVSAVEEANKLMQQELEKIKEELQKLIDLGYTGGAGDIQWGYKDYSLPENQKEMDVGVTYIVFHDENGNYIQMNPDTGTLPKKPTTMRFYIKSQSGNVSYVEHQTAIDLSGYLRREELKQATIDVQGIAELATVAETEAGTDGTRIVTPFTLFRALPNLLIKNFEQNPSGLTNNIVQQLIKTIASDTHLQEDLADSIKDDILGELEGGIGQPGEDISFEGNITFKGDNVFEGDSEFQGDVNFSGSVTVPDQVPADDPTQWPGDTVVNKDDVIKLIENSKKTSIEVLPNYPTSIDSLEEDILYSCPLEDSGNEITIITLRENEQASTATVQEGEQAFFAAGDLL